MPVIIDRYTESVTFYPFRPNHKKGKVIKRKRDFNVKNPRAVKQIKSLAKFMYETKSKDEGVYFVTITTCQHKTGLGDKELYHKLYLWLKNKNFDYINVCERQTKGYKGSTPTNDLHFHLLIRRTGQFDIKAEVSALAAKFGIAEHPSVFDVERVYNFIGVKHYLSKYFTKINPAETFKCRTYSVSNRFRKKFKEGMSRYIARLSDTFVINNFNLFKQKLRKSGESIKTEFFTCYEFTSDLWVKAVQFVRFCIKCNFDPLLI